MARSITITGTRSIPETGTDRLTTLFELYLRPFADLDTRFYVGGAIGIDTTALDWLAEHTEAFLAVVVPGAVADQPAAAVEAIRRWTEVGRLAQVVELGADRLDTPAYHARNRWMVDRSDFVIGFPLSENAAGGTRYTLNYAAKQHKPYLVIPL